MEQLPLPGTMSSAKPSRRHSIAVALRQNIVECRAVSDHTDCAGGCLCRGRAAASRRRGAGRGGGAASRTASCSSAGASGPHTQHSTLLLWSGSGDKFSSSPEVRARINLILLSKNRDELIRAISRQGTPLLCVRTQEM